MKFRMLPTAVALALATALVLTGCIPAEPVITPPPVPSATPVFASDEEALAAATEAYGKYLAVSDEIAADGGSGADRISALVTSELFQEESKSANELLVSGRHTLGSSSFRVSGLQRYEDGQDGSATVTLYVCVDVTEVRVVDLQGQDVTPANRVDKIPLEVQVRMKTIPAIERLVARNSPWTGKDFCE